MRRNRLARFLAAMVAMSAMLGLLTPVTASAGTLTSATFTAAGSGYAVTGAKNTRYDYGFTTATTATLSRVSMTVPSGTNAYGARYLSLPGANNQYASTPDSVANSVTGTIDLRAKVSFKSWTTGDVPIITKWGTSAGTNSYWFREAAGSNALQICWSNDGTSGGCMADSGASLAYSAWTTKWLRVVFQPDNGASGKTATYYVSDDGITWTQSGSVQTSAGTSSIYDGSNAVELGSTQNGTAYTAQSSGARYYYADIRNSVSGTTTSASTCTSASVVACFNPADWISGTSVTSSSTQHEVWNIYRTGANLPPDISADLTVSGVSGLPSGGSASYRMIDGAAVYVFPSPTSVTAITPCSIGLTGFTNTATAGTYSSTIGTYDNSATPVNVDSATTGVLTFTTAANNTAVSATIDPTLTFTITGQSSACRGVTPTGTATATSVNLGHINSTSPVSAAQYILVTTNAGSGVVLNTRYTGPLSDGNGHTIADVPGNGSWNPASAFPSAGTAAFGYTYGWISSGWVNMTTNNVVNKSSNSGGLEDCIVYQAQASPTTPAGSYSATVIYTAVPTF